MKNGDDMAKGKKRLKAWLWHRLMEDGPQSATRMTDILNNEQRMVRTGTYVSKPKTGRASKYAPGTIVEYYRDAESKTYKIGENRYYYSCRALKKGDDANVNTIASLLAGATGNGGTFFRKVTHGRNPTYEAIPLRELIPILRATNKPLTKFPKFIRQHVKESEIEW
tara:strand:+ start:3536 stop:4036 length:501 start_codon:yes stop_codon:yes gene_type:complete